MDFQMSDVLVPDILQDLDSSPGGPITATQITWCRYPTYVCPSSTYTVTVLPLGDGGLNLG